MAAQSEAAKEFLRLKETLTQTDVSLMVAEIKTAKKIGTTNKHSLRNSI
ncbi:hypothetical protein LOS24_03405 [Enterococcus faecium]|nr:hypothetical protein [Enterococcus faecium]